MNTDLANDIVKALNACGGRATPGVLAANLRSSGHNRSYVSAQAVINAASADERLRAVHRHDGAWIIFA